MINIDFDLEWREHPSGLLVRNDGLVYVPESGKNKQHYTYGCQDGRGYMQVVYNRKYHKVHRLVAECFIPNPNNLPECNHINEKKDDNRASNIEWCDRKYNICYGTRTERAVANTDWKAKVAHTDYKSIGRKLTNNPKMSKRVLQFTLDGKLVKKWESTKECGRNGFNQGSICQCCRGNYKTSGGYIWKYA